MSAAVTNIQAVPASGRTVLTRDELLRVAVARGGRYYAALLPPETSPEDAADLPHEMLGAALLRGEPDAETFQAIRCGAMVLSDLSNSPQRIAEAAEGTASPSASLMWRG